MTMGKTDLSVSLSLEQTAPVSGAPTVQGQSSPGGGGEDKPRRRPPPPEEAAAEPLENDADRTPHRIDSLA
jgi:hypothetical protein